MIIYEIRNKINNKIYIGQYTRNDFNSYWGSGKIVKSAIKKYGISNFDKTILEVCTSKEELDIRERYWIKEKDSINNGYNLTDGGTGGDTSRFINYSDEWREKQRINAKQYWENLSAEERKERSSKVSGENNGMYGKVGYWKDKKIPIESIQKGLETRRSYKGSENPNWKGGASFKDYCKCGNLKKPNAKTCNECRDRSGENNPFYGKTHSAATKQKMRSAIKENRNEGWLPGNARPVEINGIQYRCLSEAAEKTGIGNSLIIYRIKSNNIKYNSYKYIEN
jgi:group I intron endonuclease